MSYKSTGRIIEYPKPRHHLVMIQLFGSSVSQIERLVKQNSPLLLHAKTSKLVTKKRNPSTKYPLSRASTFPEVQHAKRIYRGSRREAPLGAELHRVGAGFQPAQTDRGDPGGLETDPTIGSIRTEQSSCSSRLRGETKNERSPSPITLAPRTKNLPYCPIPHSTPRGLPQR